MKFEVWSSLHFPAISLSAVVWRHYNAGMPGGYVTVTTVYIVTLLLLRTEGTENRGNITISR